MTKFVNLTVLVGFLFLSGELFAEEQEYHLKLVSETYDLHYYIDNSLDNHIYGVYRKHIELLGGKFIHLFPDKKFIITTFCDICPEKAIAQGTYSFEKGIIKFEYFKLDQKYSEIKNSINNLHAMWG